MILINEINIRGRGHTDHDLRSPKQGGVKVGATKCLFRPVSMTTEGDSAVHQAGEDADDNKW